MVVVGIVVAFFTSAAANWPIRA